MKKRNLKSLKLNKKSISNLEQSKGGLIGIDTQVSCYGTCMGTCICPPSIINPCSGDPKKCVLIPFPF